MYIYYAGITNTRDFNIETACKYVNSVSDPHWFQCGSGCGSGSSILGPDPDIGF
jgi:hypothetical protein